VLSRISGVLYEILGAALAAEADFAVVGTVPSEDSLIQDVDRLGADVVVFLADDLPVPVTVQALISQRPSVVVLTLAAGGRDAAVSRLVGDAAVPELVKAIRCARRAS
jgi:hypothetical protein